MKNRDSLAPLVVASVIVTSLMTFTVQFGWLAWVPVLTALAVVFGFRQKFKG